MEIETNEGSQERPRRGRFLSALKTLLRKRPAREESAVSVVDEFDLIETEVMEGFVVDDSGDVSIRAAESADDAENGDRESLDDGRGLPEARAAIVGLISFRAHPDSSDAAEARPASAPEEQPQLGSEEPTLSTQADEAAGQAPETEPANSTGDGQQDAVAAERLGEVQSSDEDGEGAFVQIEDAPEAAAPEAATNEGEATALVSPPPVSLSPAIMRADGTPLPRHRLGEYVFHKGLITSEALDAASREQEVTGERIGQILVANGFLTDKDRVQAILATSSERIAQESVARSRIPSHVLDEFNIMISAETNDTVYVSTMCDEVIVRPIIEEHYGDKAVQFVSFLPTAMNGFIAAMKKSSAIDDASQTKETMLDRLLYKALNEGASDIHIIPRRKSYTAMLRLLGVRRVVHEGALDEYKTMIAQIKDKARMDLAERRKPQDGGFQIEYSGKMIDLRVATLPTNDGEVCIMRVLDPDRVQPSLGQLGITDVAKWRKGFNQQHGLCLICGPTGSGKTTTLNSSIKEMDRFGKSIYTIEDPVEYRIPYTGQVSVNTTVGLNFATAVRAFMRADPDVIVLGEVRDEETARNAIKAADTGHLVLATLHTGSILGSVSRLKDLGVAPRELRYLLRSVLVQSLVRTTCQACGGTGHQPDHQERSCERCKGTRYAGRTVVSECEYFEDSEQVDRILEQKGDLDDVRTWPTMVEDAVKKYREGLTDLPELYRVFGASIDPVLRRQEEADA